MLISFERVVVIHTRFPPLQICLYYLLSFHSIFCFFILIQFQVMLLRHNRHTSFSMYISVLAISDSVTLTIGKIYGPVINVYYVYASGGNVLIYTIMVKFYHHQGYLKTIISTIFRPLKILLDVRNILEMIDGAPLFSNFHLHISLLNPW